MSPTHRVAPQSHRPACSCSDAARHRDFSTAHARRRRLWQLGAPSADAAHSRVHQPERRGSCCGKVRVERESSCRQRHAKTRSSALCSLGGKTPLLAQPLERLGDGPKFAASAPTRFPLEIAEKSGKSSGKSRGSWLGEIAMSRDDDDGERGRASRSTLSTSLRTAKSGAAASGFGTAASALAIMQRQALALQAARWRRACPGVESQHSNASFPEQGCGCTALPRDIDGRPRLRSMQRLDAIEAV